MAYELAHRGMLTAIDTINAGFPSEQLLQKLSVMRKAGSKVGIDTMIASE